ncbi:MAG: glycosyltransferase family 4 protein [Ruminococcaceae bacterium]|nr:glycosyltransferase family 4 protein [Oscillospiraceae bacterium]
MEKLLRVGIGTDAYYPTIDGGCLVARCYADIINEKLGEAIVITPKNPNAEDYRFPYQIYRYKSLFTFGEGYPVGWPFKEVFANDVIDMNLDILHSHCPIATSYFFRRINRKKRIPTVLTYHTKYEYDYEARLKFNPALKARAYGMTLNNIKAADEVWITSEGTSKSLRNMGYEGDYIVMPNGCDLPKAVISENERMSIRRKHNIPEDVPILLFVGRLMWYKNIQMILDACKLLKNDGIDFRMIMLGIGPDEGAIKKYTRKLALDDRVIFTGQIINRKDIQIYYGAADLLVFPSTFDTNGLVVREAAACATPSILVEGSCASEGIIDAETGFLCLETPHSLYRKISNIIGNKDLLSRVGLNAQDDIYISWDESVKNAFERYRIVIDKFNSKPHSKYQF